MDNEVKLPRDPFSVALRNLEGNPAVVQASSRVDIVDDYGRSQTWTIDTYRADGQETVLLQRMSAEDPLRLVLPPQVTSTMTRQHDGLTAKMRVRGARQAVATRRLRGDQLGNPAALEQARKKKKRNR